MTRTLLLACCAALALVPVARADFYSITGPDGLDLVVTRKGGVGLYPLGHPQGGETYWDVSAPGVSVVTVHSKRLRGHYLAYDPTGKKPGVWLVSERGPGTQWRFVKAKGGVTSHTIQAAEGKVKGRYLDLGEAKKARDKGGKAHTGYDLTLTEKPKKPARFRVEIIAP